MNSAVSAVRTRREEIARAIERLKAEDGELAAAERVLVRLGGEESRAAAPVRRAGIGAHPAPKPSAVLKPVKGSPRSQRTLVIELLSSCDPAWLRSVDIVKQVKAQFGVDIPERSLRPLLSAMKRERVIARSGRQVALSERV